MARIVKWLKRLMAKCGSLVPEKEEGLKFDASKLERYFIEERK